MAKRKLRKIVSRETTDEAVVELVLTSDPGYFTELVTRYQKKLYLYLTYMIGANDEREDLLQNVFSKAFSHLKEFDTQRKFSSWIYRIAHNEAVNHLKRLSYRQLVDWESLADAKEKVWIVDTSESLLESQARDEARIAVRQALNTLPEKDREILQLRYYLDKTYAEMSVLLNLPENTIASKLSRAKKKLLQALNISYK